MWILSVMLAVGVSTPARPSSVNLAVKDPPSIDGAAWVYEGNYGTGFAPIIQGSAERIDVLPPNVTNTENVLGIELFRRPFDYQGYPMRVSLVDKLFAMTQKLEYVVASTVDGAREYDTRRPAYEETVLHGPGAGDFRASGPVPANGPIIEQYQAAFSYAVRTLDRLDVPSEQKDLSHYVVMFVDTPNTTWMEFGPAFAPGETPHLGCQTQLGRDMVFGYEKGGATEPQSAPLIPCF